MCTATCGPGTTQLATAFVTAARASSPVVAFCGEYPVSDDEYTQALDQSAFAHGCEAAFVRMGTAEDADEARRLIEGHQAAASDASLGPGESMDYDALQASLGYVFRDRGLLEQALTHRSRANEDVTGGVADNESLEFLGDAVLGFVIADMLFHHFPTHDEGYKSKVKASIVSAVSLARLAEDIDLGRYILLGRGEEKT